MTAADSASLNWWSGAYTIGAWCVVAGVVLEGAEIFARRSAKMKLRKTIGPFQNPLTEPPIPHSVHSIGDIGFVILILALVVEQVSHQRMEAITGRERDRLTAQLDASTILAGEANRQAGLANERAKKSEADAQQFRVKADKLEALSMRRVLSPEDEAGIVNGLQKYAGVKFAARFEEDSEVRRLVEQIRQVLGVAQWKEGWISARTTPPLPSGVMNGPGEFDTIIWNGITVEALSIDPDGKPTLAGQAADALITELNIRHISATRRHNLELNHLPSFPMEFGTVYIFVGFRPNSGVDQFF